MALNNMQCVFLRHYFPPLAGIYIHIPFCKQACHYCDFHFSTNQIRLNDMVNAILSEIKLRKTYLDGEVINTIYYGGGTPSILKSEHIQQIQQAINSNFKVAKPVEVTFECNPDDLSKNYLTMLNSHGINRLSIGVQSFDNTELTKLNRAHTSKEAENAIQTAQSVGIQNITIDLIYGLPNSDLDYWKRQIDQALKLGIKHISAYCLTFEEQTAFGNWLKKGKISPLSDEKNLAQFQYLVSALKAGHFEHYEISNFAIDSYISKHNSAYWLGEKYLGIGPSAHSFNGTSRQWNISNNPTYIKNMGEDKPFFQKEVLSDKDIFNEYILTRLRTKWGLEKNYLSIEFPQYNNKIKVKLDSFKQSNQITETDTHYYLTEKGKFIADHITSELFMI